MSSIQDSLKSLAGDSRALTATVVLLAISYVVGNVVYQLYLSPLAQFPGPKLAAVTRLYETYYDLLQWGQYTFEIKRMHEEYGPIVRISPYELHINDPAYIDVLYTRSAPRDKYDFFTRQFGNPLSSFSTVHHAHHRMRRAALNPFFSKQRLLKLEALIWDLVEKLCSRLDEHKKSGQPVPARLAYGCFTMDVIVEYAMGRKENYLDDPDFSPMFTESIKNIASFGVFFKHVPWMYKVLRALPENLVAWLNPGMGAIFTFTGNVQRQIRDIMDDTTADKSKYLVKGQPTIFHDIINSDLPPEEKTHERLWQEGQVVVGAGADTTANALNTATFYLLDNPDKLAKLTAELTSAIPDDTAQTPLLSLEKLPYLTAVILECLRLSYGVSSRNARLAPEPLKYKQWVIPPHTPVGMTTPLLHHDESIFPDSHAFVPERWLEPQPDGRPLERYLMSFGRGGRQCAGMALAKAELYIVLATIFRRYRLELFETTKVDIEMKHDLFLPQPDYNAKGVRVLVK